ncbi:MAG: Gfo/Idh/MocA family oxidoreductase [Bacteroidota bacterium]
MAQQEKTSTNQAKPLRIGVVGLHHTHVHWILGEKKNDQFEIVGIVEPNRELALRYSAQHGFPMSIVYNTIEEMVSATHPEAVTAFNTIYGHLKVVEYCAPKGIHVMVEKPLAVSLDHAKKMQALAEKYKIQLLTNYETSWYSTNHKAFEMLNVKKSIGELRKVVVHDGHQGPKEIGVDKEFLEWLTDPVQNGGGAITDFGCYGANLMTWLAKGERPTSVTAITQQIKPDIYPDVDDDATIIVQYAKHQGIIQASWNWPFNRKDMEVYGTTGYVFADNRTSLRVRSQGEEQERKEVLEEQDPPMNNPFLYFAAVVRGSVIVPQFDLSSLENNIIVMEILDAAIRSSKSGKTMYFDKK